MSFFDFLGFGNSKPKVEITENLIAAAKVAKKELDSENNFFKTFDDDDFCKTYADDLTQVFICCDKLMNEVTDVLELNKNNFNTQPLTHLIFASADDMFNIIGSSESIREFATTNEFLLLPEESKIYAFLIADKKIKKQLGVAEVNGQIQYDVMQKFLYFDSEYFSAAIATNLETLREKLRVRFVFMLVQKFNGIVAHLKQQKEDLRIQIELEKSKLLLNKNLAETNTIQNVVDDLEKKYDSITKLLTPEYQQDEFHKFLQSCDTFMNKRDMHYKINSLGLIYENYDENSSSVNDVNDDEIMSLDFPEFTLVYSEKNSTDKVGFFVSVSKKDAVDSIEKVNAIRNKSRYV